MVQAWVVRRRGFEAYDRLARGVGGGWGDVPAVLFEQARGGVPVEELSVGSVGTGR